MCASGLTILDAVLVLFMRAQSDTPRKLLATDATRVLHLLDVGVSLDLVADEIGHLIETLAADIALVRTLICMGEHVVAQIA